MIKLFSFQDPKRQRLIYSGKGLNDSSRIGEILRVYSVDEATEEPIHVFHLVYTPSMDELKKQRMEPTYPKEEGVRHRTSAAPIPPSGVTGNQSAEVLPQIRVGNAPPSGDVNEYWMQMQHQMYSAYMANYMN